MERSAFCLRYLVSADVIVTRPTTTSAAFFTRASRAHELIAGYARRMQAAIAFTSADIAYIEANFIALEEQPPGPGPSYVLEDGRAFYPRDYQDQEVDEGRFRQRMAREMQRLGFSDLDPDSEWKAYLAGLYGVCLRSATPENIVRKEELLHRIDGLLRGLREAVDALDALEREFAPDYDRARFGRPTTRDTHITKLRSSFLACDAE